MCNIIIGYRKRVCDKCNPKKVDWSQVTFKEITDRRKYQKNSQLRNMARALYLKHNNKPVCHVCGYDKYCEIHHIRPIASFSDDSPVSEINCLENLVALCPNHHLEVELNLVSIVPVSEIASLT